MDEKQRELFGPITGEQKPEREKEQPQIDWTKGAVFDFEAMGFSSSSESYDSDEIELEKRNRYALGVRDCTKIVLFFPIVVIFFKSSKVVTKGQPVASRSENRVRASCPQSMAFHRGVFEINS